MGYHSRSRSIKRGPAGSRHQEENCTGRSVLVKNLNFKTNADAIRREFDRFGDIKDIYIPLDYRTQRAKGFGFIEFYHAEDASTAVSDMDQARIEGNTIHVCIAQNRRKSPSSMRHRDNRGVQRRSPSPYRRRRTPPRRRSSSRSRSYRGRGKSRGKSRRSSRSCSRK